MVLDRLAFHLLDSHPFRFIFHLHSCLTILYSRANFPLFVIAPRSGNVTTQWRVNVPTGTTFVLFYEGTDGSLASTGLMRSVSAPTGDDSCLISSPVTTVGQTGTSFVTRLSPTAHRPSPIVTRLPSHLILFLLPMLSTHVSFFNHG